MLTEAGNPKSKLPLAPLSKIREVLWQIALRKQHYKPPESATKTPLDCLREKITYLTGDVSRGEDIYIMALNRLYYVILGVSEAFIVV
jgi:hypothetical protein